MICKHLGAVLHHRTEFQAPEGAAVSADAGVGIEHAAAVGEPDQKGKHQEERAQKQHRRQRGRDVKTPLQRASWYGFGNGAVSHPYRQLSRTSRILHVRLPVDAIGVRHENAAMQHTSDSVLFMKGT